MKTVNEITNPRLISYLECMSLYAYTCTWRPSKDMVGAETLFWTTREGRDDTQSTIRSKVAAMEAGKASKELPSDHPDRELAGIWDTLST